MTARKAAQDEAGAASRIVRMVASGAASSRSELADLLGLARSTVSLRVQELIDAGLLTETGEGPSRGGRRPRLLRPRADGGFVLAADLGGRHVRLGALDTGNVLLHAKDFALDVTAGPDAVLADLHAIAGRFIQHESLSQRRLLAIGVGVPGPVDFATGTVVGPSRMPGWHGFAVRTRLSELFHVPVVIDNDANLLAVGEYHTRGRPGESLVVVKAGTGIGTGVIASGQVHRGANGVAGDVSHVRVPAAGETPCSCGNTGCLETIGSGAAILATVAAKGIEVATPDELAVLATNADPEVTPLVRFAGRQLGEVLSTVVNFFNPNAVLLTGRLATIEPYVAAVRGVLYERCLPVATQSLEIDLATAGPDAGILGGGILALEQIFT